MIITLQVYDIMHGGVFLYNSDIKICIPFAALRVAGCLGITTPLVDRYNLDADLPMPPH